MGTIASAIFVERNAAIKPHGADECPRCKLKIKETAKELIARQGMKTLFQEINQIVKEAWEDLDAEDDE